MRAYLGELIGTFILVLIGCGSVAVAVLYGTIGLLEVALIWGFGVSLAIFATRKICPAHLNPAVSLAMYIAGKLKLRALPLFIVAQFFGAVLAGTAVYLVFQNDIANYEAENQIIRGTAESNQTAMMFGEYYPNPGYADTHSIGTFGAMLMEGLGTFALVFSIFQLLKYEERLGNWLPVMIGATVTVIICFVAPYTQAGLNPARDFGPRLVASFSGWGEAAFPDVSFGFFTVYILGPLIGGSVAAFLTLRTNK